MQQHPQHHGNSYSHSHSAHAASELPLQQRPRSGTPLGTGGHSLDRGILSGTRPTLADRRRSSRTSTGPYTLRNSASFSSISSDSGSGASPQDAHTQSGHLQQHAKQFANLPPASAANSAYAAHVQSQSWLGVGLSGQGLHYQPDAAYSHSHSRSSSFSSVASDLSSASTGTAWSETEYHPSIVGSLTASGSSSTDAPFPPPSAHTAQHEFRQPHHLGPKYSFPPPGSTGALAHPVTLSLPMLASSSISTSGPLPHANTGLGQQLADGDPELIAYANNLRTGTLSNSHAEKVRVAFVHHWLNQSFHQHPEGNVSRQGLYSCYLQACTKYDTTPMNAASYGKAVRSCWPGIKTRRLGVRGQSRYHFCGVRPSNKETEDALAAADAALHAAANAALAAAAAAAATAEGADAPPGAQEDEPMAAITLSMPKLLNAAPSARSSTSPNGSGSGSTGGHSSTNASPTDTKERMQSYDSYCGDMHEDEDDSGFARVQHDAGGKYLPVFQVENYGQFDLPVPATAALRRQASAPSLMHLPSPNAALGDISFPDLKTPTAPAFLHNQQQHSAAYSFGTSASAEAAGDDTRLGLGLGLGSPPDAAWLKGRRATVPNLQITIPPLHGGPVSAQPQPHPHPLREGSLRTLPTLREMAGLPVSACASSGTKHKIELDLPSFENVLAEVYCFDGQPHPLQASLKTLDKSAATYLWNTYKSEHCQVLLRLFGESRFAEFGHAASVFWTSLSPDHARIVQHPVVSQAMYRADAAVYGALLDHLRAKLLASSARRAVDSESVPPNSPGGVSQTQLHELKATAAGMENALANVLGTERFDESFSGQRIELVSRVAHLLSRHIGLVQLAQAVQGIFAESSNAKDGLLAAWDSVLDLDNLVNQTALITGCTQQNVLYFLDEFRSALGGLPSSASSSGTATQTQTGPDAAGSGNAVKAFADFADRALIFALAGQEHDSADAPGASNIAQKETQAKDFLVKWSYVANQVMRDLTIASSPAFGSFQVISLFIQEWLAFTVLKDASLHASAVAASIAAEAANNGRHAQPGMPSGMPTMLFAEPSSGGGGAYLVSPSLLSFSTAEGPRSARSLLHPNVAGHPSGLPSNGLLSASGMSFNISSALTPTTRAFFGQAGLMLDHHQRNNSPMYLNFGHHAPATPSAALFNGAALALQRSPGLRPGFGLHGLPTAANGQQSYTNYATDDFVLPPQSPIKMSYTRASEEEGRERH